MNMRWSWLLLGGCSTGNTDSYSPEELPGPPLGVPHHQPAPQIPGEMNLIGEKSPDSKSILIISWDTVRQDMAGLNENPGIRELQSQGTSFTQAMTHFPETGISHWSLMTGVEPEIHGNVPGSGGSRYKGPTLSEIAKEMGYSTAAFIGGITLTDQATGLGRGFDRYDDQWDWMKKDVRPGAELVSRASTWMESQNQPFFAFVHFFEAHHPYEMQPGHEKAPSSGPRPADVEQQVAQYKSEIAYLDSMLPRLMEAAGEETVIVLTSDHGESFEHDYLYNHRESLWDSTMNIPLILRGPGMSPGSVSNRLVALTDVLPTVLEMAGLPLDSKIQGQSILGDAPPREFVVALTDPWSGGVKRTALRSLTHKVIWGQEETPIAFNVQIDPQEINPLEALPQGFEEALKEHTQGVLNAAGLQHEELPTRFLAEDEVKRLQSLGYLGAPPGPPNPPHPSHP